MAREGTRMSTRLLPFTVVPTGMGQVVLVKVWLSDCSAETVVVRHAFTVVITAFRTRPHEDLGLEWYGLEVFVVFVVVDDPFFGAFHVERLETLTTVPDVLTLGDCAYTDETITRG
jgi:hypothetical protein